MRAAELVQSWQELLTCLVTTARDITSLLLGALQSQQGPGASEQGEHVPEGDQPQEPPTPPSPLSLTQQLPSPQGRHLFWAHSSTGQQWGWARKVGLGVRSKAGHPGKYAPGVG